MKIVDFTLAHIPAAHSLALTCYQEERRYVPELPAMQDVPNLPEFAQTGMGVAALEGERLLGFLCGTAPFEHAFGSTDCTGVFSPMGAHGAVPEGRERIYGAMYQRAAEKWVRAGAVSHGICLYAHDEAAIRWSQSTPQSMPAQWWGTAFSNCGRASAAGLTRWRSC